MNLTEWNPFRDLDTAAPFRFFDTASIPKVDVYQTKTNVVIKAEMPGISKDDLNVYITEDSINISAERKRTEEYSTDNIYRSERYYGNVSRTIALPAEINTSSAKAEYKDGVLSIIAPKSNSTNTKQHKLAVE